MEHVIRTYRPGDVDRVIERHRALYYEEFGLDGTFCDYVDKYMREFERRNDTARECLWVLEADGAACGCIAIVDGGSDGAQLRWFLIEPGMRGKGAGTALVRAALDFCRQAGYKHVFLWTLSILDAALAVYKKFGFALTQQKPNDEWRAGLTEERYDLEL